MILKLDLCKFGYITFLLTFNVVAEPIARYAKRTQRILQFVSFVKK